MSDDSSGLNVLMSFLLDKESVQKVDDGISSISDQLKDLGKTDSDIASANKELQGTGVAVNDTAKAVNTLPPAMNSVSKGVTGMKNSFSSMRTESRAIMMVSRELAVAGGVFVALISKGAADFVKNGDQTLPVVKEWKAAQESIKESTLAMGKTFAEAVLPSIQASARLMKTIADILTAHPELAKLAFGAGTILASVGAAGLLVSQVIRTASYLQATAKILLTAQAVKGSYGVTGGLIGPAVAGAAPAQVTSLTQAFIGLISKLNGGTVAITTIGGAISALILPIGIVVGAFLLINAGLKKLGVSWSDLWTTMKQMATVTIAVIGSLIQTFIQTVQSGDWKNFGANWTKNMDAMTISTGRLLGVVNDASQSLEDFAKSAEPAYAQAQDDITQATADYAKQRVQIETDSEKQRTQIVSDYGKAVKTATDNYNKANSQATEEYYQSSADAASSYHDSQARAEADGLKTLKDLQDAYNLDQQRSIEDHNLKMKDLLGSRDAIALGKEQESFDLEEKRKKEDYDKSVSQANTQLQQTLSQNAASFAKERQQAAIAFAQKLKDNATNYAQERAQAKADEDQKLKDLQDSETTQIQSLQQTYQDQVAAINKTLNDSLRQLSSNIFGDQQVIDNASKQRLIDTENWLIANTAQFKNYLPVTGHAATGGYVGSGLYKMGELGPEFVLNNRTTRAAEQMIGGRLTQQNVLSGAGNYSDHRTLQFNGMTENDRVSIRQDIYDITKQAFQEAMS